MSQSRNRSPDKRAISILELVNIDLVGPVDPIAKDDFKIKLIIKNLPPIPHIKMAQLRERGVQFLKWLDVY